MRGNSVPETEYNPEEMPRLSIVSKEVLQPEGRILKLIVRHIILVVLQRGLKNVSRFTIMLKFLEIVQQGAPFIITGITFNPSIDK